VVSETDFDEASCVFDFAEMYLRDVRAGRERTLAEYQARFAGYEDEIEREWRRLRGVNAETPAAPRLPEVAGFEILEELGRGGQGRVWRARETALGRLVALKILRTPTGVLGPRRRARLRREVEVVARLDHPGLCAVHRANLEADPPWVAMRHVEGETLAELLRGARQPPPGEDETPTAGSAVADRTPSTRSVGPGDSLQLRRLLRLFERVARALHAAHEAGVVHRDVKPANIMVDRRDEPVVLDFGLARLDDESDPLTRSGETFGTPAYMSPEQILEPAGGLDRRTDVYSLGVTLYECLTLERPYPGLSGRRLEQAICERPAADPAALNPVVPPDLRVVLETAMDKERARRYPTALALAEDLRRVRMYEPIAARPAGPLVHLRRWIQRNPPLAAATLGLLVVLASGLAVTVSLLANVRSERDRAERGARRMRALAMAHHAMLLAEDDPADALLLALEAAEGQPGFETNNALLAALSRCRLERRLAVPEHGGWTDLDVSPSGDRLAIAQGSVNVFDVATGERLLASESAGDARAVDFDPAGRRLVVGGADGALAVLDARDGRRLRRLGGHDDTVRAVRFDPTGARIASVGDDETARLWDAASGRAVAVLDAHAEPVTDLAFGPRGALLVTAAGAAVGMGPGADPVVRLWDGRTGAPRARLEAHEGTLTAVAVAPDASVVATAGIDGTARLWSARDGTPLAVLEHPGPVHEVLFTAGGARLLTCFDPGDVREGPPFGAWIWQVPGGRRVVELDGRGYRAVYCAALSPDGTRLATGSFDRLVRVFDARTGELQEVLRGGAGMVYELAWPTPGRLVSAYMGSVDLWSLAPREGMMTIAAHEAPVLDAVFLPSGERLVSASADGTARLHEVATGAPGPALRGHEAMVVSARACAGGARIATASTDGTARLWDAGTGEPLAVLAHPGRPPLVLAEPSPDGALLLTAAADGTARLWDAASGRLARELEPAGGEVVSADWSPDGALVALGDAERAIHLHEARTGEVRATLRRWADSPEGRRYGRVFDLDFGADGRLLAAACQDLFVRFWSVPDGAFVGEVGIVTPGRVRLLDGPEPLAVTTAQWNPTVSLVHATRGRLYSGRTHHADRTSCLDVHPGGELVVTGSYDGTARVWNAATRQPHAQLTGHDGPIHRVRFAPDGDLVMTAGQDGTVRLWPTHPRELAERRRPFAWDEAARAEHGF